MPASMLGFLVLKYFVDLSELEISVLRICTPKKAFGYGVILRRHLDPLQSFFSEAAGEIRGASRFSHVASILHDRPH